MFDGDFVCECVCQTKKKLIKRNYQMNRFIMTKLKWKKLFKQIVLLIL